MSKTAQPAEMKRKWTKFTECWPVFTLNDILVRGPEIGERKVKFQAAFFPHLPSPARLAGFGFLFSDCTHPMQNAAVSMDKLLEWKDLPVEMNGSADGPINASRNTETSSGGLILGERRATESFQEPAKNEPETTNSST